MKELILALYLLHLLGLSGCGQPSTEPPTPAPSTPTATAPPVTALPPRVAVLREPASKPSPTATPAQVPPVLPEETPAVAASTELLAVQTPPPPTPQSDSTTEPKTGDKRELDGKKEVWLDGFGWIPDHSDQPNVCIVLDGEGDINKMVGSMGGEEPPQAAPSPPPIDPNAIDQTINEIPQKSGTPPNAPSPSLTSQPDTTQ